jgi:thioredoxin reductase (NADPH)
VIEARSVVIATGSVNRKLGVPGEDRLLGRGVFVCATCDAALYEDQRVVVVGGGDSALQEALDLAKFAGEVTLVHRRGELRACACLKARAEEDPKIRFTLNTVVEEIIGGRRVEAVSLRNLATGEATVKEAEGVLIAVGWEPNTGILRGQLNLDESGYVVADGVKTSVEGVYVAGDLVDRVYRQVVTSCGSGCMAAIEAERYLAGGRGAE